MARLKDLVAARGDRRLVRRPGLGAAPPTAVATPAVMGLSGAIFYLSGALVALVVSFADESHGANPHLEQAIAVVAALAGVVVALGRHRIPRVAYHPMNLAGTTMVALLVVAAGPGRAAGALAVLFLYVPLDSFFFFSVPSAIAYQVFGVAGVVGVAVRGDIDPVEAVALVVVSAVVAFVVAWLVRAAALAETDPVTGLPNRAGLRRAMRQAIAVAERTGAPLAVSFVDIDRFDAFNEQLGFAAGDDLLRQVAGNLVRALPAPAFVARYGGDGFAFLLPGAGPEAARELTEDLRRTVAGGRPCSAGVSPFYPGDTLSLFGYRARSALYEAKQAGRDRTVLRVSNQAEVAELTEALAAGQLEVAFQPIVELPSGRVVGAEALVRWNHPERGPVRPDTFVALAEEGELIVELGRFVLCSALRQAAGWPLPSKLNVNASGRELSRAGYAGQVLAVLAETGFDPARLVLEVTESSLEADSAQTLANLDELRRNGIRVALDDFGTGYSSFARLDRLPIDVVKLDKSFVEGIGDQDEAPLVKAICVLARETGRRVVAEGIEHPGQAAVLAAQGCDEGQGYLFGRPASGAALGAMLERARPPSAPRGVFAGRNLAADRP